MTKFNINNSKIEQLNDSGDNYKLVGNAKDQAAGEPSAANPESTAIEGMPFRPYKRFASQSFGLVEYHSHLQKSILDGGAEEAELRAIGGRAAVLASIRRHLPSFDPAEAQTAYGPAWVNLKPILVRSGLSPVDERTTLTDIKAFLDAAAVASPGGTGKSEAAKVESEDIAVADGRNVFVIHGRNQPARDAMFTFLRAVGLNPIEWDEAVKMTGKASPYVGEILDSAFSNAQAVVAVLTGDDIAHLRPDLQHDDDPEHEKNPTPQARQNVLFEAGMAFGRHPERTIMVELGTLRPFSDVAGRHTVRFRDTPQSRSQLRERLKTAHSAIKESGTDWMTAGDFDTAIKLAAGKPGKT